MKKLLLILLFKFSAITVLSQSIRKEIEKELYNNPENIGKGISISHKNSNLFSNSVGFPKLKRKESKKNQLTISTISKQFVGAAIYLLLKEGKLKLNQKISDFFPDYCSIGLKITINHLLTHSSGIVDYQEIIPKDFNTTELSNRDVLELVKLINNTHFQPGTQFKYNNTSYCLLALIVEQISGNSFSDFLNEEIFKPLRMTYPYDKINKIKDPNIDFQLSKNKQNEFHEKTNIKSLKGDWGINLSIGDFVKWQKSRELILGIDYREMFNLSNIKVDEHTNYSFGHFVFFGKPSVLIHSGSTGNYSYLNIEIPSTATSVFYYTNLENSSISFLPIEQILKKYKILPENFSSKVYHEIAN